MKSLEAEEGGAAALSAQTAAPDTPSQEQPAATDGDQQSTEGTAPGADSASPPPAKSKVTELTVEPIVYPGRLTERELRMYRELELQMANEDRLHREKQERMNELETAVYAVRDGLGSTLAPYASDEEKATLGKLLEELENWVYDHQDDPQLTKSAIVAKLDSLKQVASPVQRRQQQRELRQAAAEKLRDTIKVGAFGNGPKKIRGIHKAH